jgi:hypothetical protein
MGANLLAIGGVVYGCAGENLVLVGGGIGDLAGKKLLAIGDVPCGFVDTHFLVIGCAIQGRIGAPTLATFTLFVAATFLGVMAVLAKSWLWCIVWFNHRVLHRVMARGPGRFAASSAPE